MNAVREDGSPIRHEWYSDEFQRLRQRVSLRRIHLKGLRNTSVSLMFASGIPVHVVAAWHGHDPALSLSIYSDAQREDLRAAGRRRTLRVAPCPPKAAWDTAGPLGQKQTTLQKQETAPTLVRAGFVCRADRI